MMASCKLRQRPRDHLRPLLGARGSPRSRPQRHLTSPWSRHTVHQHRANQTRMYQQKFVTGAIIAVLVLLIIIVIWSKLFG